jgi:transcriptional regulator with XRE-family HTH domain
METKLAENIRAFRKARALTQEQLAEVLNVTAGAVYKWEAKLSVPELDLIMEMADFFDVSVDVLLGYEMKDNRIESTVQRLREYRRRKDRAGLAEAEKALKKYPHSFRIVNECASIYRGVFYERGDRKLGMRALELSEKTLPLLPQNTDPEISVETVYGRIAEIYMGLGETEKGIELFKKHNAGGLYNHKIGSFLADGPDPDEAAPYLSESMVNCLAVLVSTVTGYANMYGSRKDYSSAEAILNWWIGMMRGLRKEGKPNFFDKVNCGFFAALALVQLLQGRKDDARDSLKRAKELADFFDSDPSYDESDIRFIDRIEGASAHDDLGTTALEGLEKTIKAFENEELIALWNKVKGEK